MIQLLSRLGGGFAPFLTALAAALPASASPSAYPYCYIDYDGLRSCSFRTLQECYSIRVGTGMCVTNPYYAGSKKAR